MKGLKNLQLGENARMALRTVRQNKVRSILTVLGVVIGVSALIFVASIMVGIEEDMTGYLNDYGPNTLFVFKFDPGIHIGRLSAEERSRKPLDLEDEEAIRQLPAVKDATVEVFPLWTGGPPPAVTARYGDHEIANIDYTGTLPSYEDVYNANVREGRFFTDAENEHRDDVAVIGSDIADTFFAKGEALGKNILVDGISYRVIGVFETRKGNFFKDQSADRTVKVPYLTYRKHHPGDKDHFIGVSPYPGMKSQAIDEVRELLRRRRKVPFDKKDNFGISSADAIATQFNQIMGSIFILTVVISAIGLLVGGVGVMNIMLMSVTERTREIGVRKAIGARRRDIIWQFLTEAITLTGLGGLIGVFIGFMGSVLMNLLLPNWDSSVPVWAVVLGVAVSMTVGLFFGMYPAVKAARLDPVEALRYE